MWVGCSVMLCSECNSWRISLPANTWFTNFHLQIFQLSLSPSFGFAMDVIARGRLKSCSPESRTCDLFDRLNPYDRLKITLSMEYNWLYLSFSRHPRPALAPTSRGRVCQWQSFSATVSSTPWPTTRSRKSSCSDSSRLMGKSAPTRRTPVASWVSPSNV